MAKFIIPSKLIAASVLLILAGCAINWTRPGTTQAQMQRDSAECHYEAIKNEGSGDAVEQGMHEGDIEFSCMRLRGYN